MSLMKFIELENEIEERINSIESKIDNTRKLIEDKIEWNNATKKKHINDASFLEVFSKIESKDLKEINQEYMQKVQENQPKIVRLLELREAVIEIIKIYSSISFYKQNQLYEIYYKFYLDILT